MDAPEGLHELVSQADFARQNRHNPAVVNGPRIVARLLAMTATEQRLVLVGDPDDLAPQSAMPDDGSRSGLGLGVAFRAGL